MRRFLGAAFTTFVVCVSIGAAGGDDGATAILGKSIDAMGGEESSERRRRLPGKPRADCLPM